MFNVINSHPIMDQSFDLSTPIQKIRDLRLDADTIADDPVYLDDPIFGVEVLGGDGLFSTKMWSKGYLKKLTNNVLAEINARADIVADQLLDSLFTLTELATDRRNKRYSLVHRRQFQQLQLISNHYLVKTKTLESDLKRRKTSTGKQATLGPAPALRRTQIPTSSNFNNLNLLLPPPRPFAKPYPPKHRALLLEMAGVKLPGKMSAKEPERQMRLPAKLGLSPVVPLGTSSPTPSHLRIPLMTTRTPAPKLPKLQLTRLVAAATPRIPQLKLERCLRQVTVPKAPSLYARPTISLSNKSINRKLQDN